MTYDFDAPVDRRASDSAKWAKYRGRDVLPLWVADMDFRSPPEVIAALAARVEHGVFGYPAPAAELRDTTVAMLGREYGWRVDPEWLVWLPGVMTGVAAACRLARDAGDECLTLVPAYPPFLRAPEENGRRLVTVPMVQSRGRWEMDFDRLAAAVTPRTRVLMHCNPHNPTGRALGRDELTRLGELCLRHDLVISADEIHCGLVLDEGARHIPIATLSAEVAARTVTFMAPTKTFNLPGLGFAFAVVSDGELRRELRRLLAAMHLEHGIMGFTAALAAYRDGGPWRDALIEYLRGNRDLVEREVAGMKGLSMSHVEATYLAWIDATGLGVENPATLFERSGVGLSDGKAFGWPGWVRLNFACPRSTLVEALARLRRAVEDR